MPYAKFLRFLQYEKRFSQHTLTAYGIDLKQFFHFMGQTYQAQKPEEITHFFIRSWIVSLLDRKIDSRTVNRKISSLKTYFKFLMREKTISQNPMLKIVSPKTAKKLPVIVDRQKMDQLLDGVAFKEGFEGIRDKLIINMFYQTGMRLAELIGLKDTNVDLYNLTLKVLGKRNKERIIPITPEMKEAIVVYLNERNNIIDEKIKSKYFFIKNDGNKLYPKFVYKVVNVMLSQVTTNKKRSPHVLRHTFATEMLNSGAQINAIKEILGHSSLAATQVYTHNTIDKLKNIYKQAHPKA
ncbi:MAG TPA: tyrosine-type recombinase/integrase [Bacteroidia bacterium]|jgi:integrase/recombinase XerC|nr:tyrosine-type recombinase/integrase [Bacteroidia bacterium]HMU19634.1 tyrosine-type recombinase/integrase [Bacteroidia bacterium]